MVCLPSTPHALVVKAKPTNTSLPHKFRVKVDEMFHDSAIVEIERLDSTSGWDWMSLTFQFTIYTSDEIGDDWYRPGSGYLYKLLPDKTNHNLARDACEELGGWLIIYGEIDHTVREQLKKRYRSLLNNKNYWIGLTDKDKEGEWIWDDWTAVDSSQLRWKEGEPNGQKNSNCVISTRYAWYDINCNLDTKYQTLCERPDLEQNNNRNNNKT
uniref:hepatic lectin n=1 Tax=Ciona intestinalis TaxID=7719 RepID=UPI000521B077|nr:hepatic lectin [Ciona intestinalis]|eukprot:XP_026691933.1 hepatic lectin [Ciona intestinalis]